MIYQCKCRQIMNLKPIKYSKFFQGECPKCGIKITYGVAEED